MFLWALICLAFLSPGVGVAAAGCGKFYTVARGDTLHAIAAAHYGRGAYEAVFEANRDLLPGIAELEVGQQLWIPCLDGSGPRTRAEALAARGGDAPSAPSASVAAVTKESDGLGFLTGSDFAPFADERLPEGGMVPELVRLAMARAAPGREISITFVNDWSAHLKLLEDGSYHLGFPWYKPDCARVDRLSESMRRRCADFDFSRPLFEVAVAWYVRAADPLAASTEYGQLAGHKLCRPADFFTFDLEQEGLATKKTLVIAPTAADCLVMLDRGDVDVASLGLAGTEAEITRLGLKGKFTEIPALASAQTLHVLAAKNDPVGQEGLKLVNKGLEELQSTGRWFEVVSRHFGAFGITLR